MLSKDVLIFFTFTTVVSFVIGSPLATTETTITRRPRTTLTYDASTINNLHQQSTTALTNKTPRPTKRIATTSTVYHFGKTTTRPKATTLRSTNPAWLRANAFRRAPDWRMNTSTEALWTTSSPPENTSNPITFAWDVIISTADQKNADTDANVYIQIFGDNGSSPILHLDNSGSNDFERGGNDIFRVKIDKDLGTPMTIRVWHDNAGHSPDWKVEWIALTPMRISKFGLLPYNIFFCGCWIDGGKSGGTEMRRTDSEWKITIVTSDVTAAGTDDDVTVVLHGERGHSRPLTLDSPKDDFERGSTQRFPIVTFDIGTPTFITVTAGEDGDGWRLDKIVLENMDGAKSYTFECYCWFDSDSYPKETTRIIYLNKNPFTI